MKFIVILIAALSLGCAGTSLSGSVAGVSASIEGDYTPPAHVSADAHIEANVFAVFCELQWDWLPIDCPEAS